MKVHLEPLNHDRVCCHCFGVVPDSTALDPWLQRAYSNQEVVLADFVGIIGTLPLRDLLEDVEVLDIAVRGTTVRDTTELS